MSRWRSACWWSACVLALLSRGLADGILPSGYSRSNPTFDHENIAIRLDAAGRQEEAHQSFVASAHFSDGVTSLDNLGVSHMRRGEWLLAAQSFGRALSRHSPTNNLEANIETFKGKLGQWGVDADTRRQCLSIVEGGAASAARWPSPEALYVGERVVRDEVYAPLHRQFANRSAFWKFLRTDAFTKAYWERRPLHVTVGEGGGPESFASVMPLADVLGDTYTFAMEKGNHRERNVHLVKGSFLQGNTEGFQFNDVITARELKRALGSGHTAIFHAHQKWVASIRQFHQSLSRATKRHANTNTYLSGPGLAVSMAAHNDMQDTFIVQTHGAKRWLLWVAPQAMLPVSDDLVYGKTRTKELDASSMGEPYADVHLEAGDVLYVPRGCIHMTSTATTTASGAAATEPSLHLTVGLDVMMNVGDGDSLDLSHFHFLGGNPRSRAARQLLPKLQEALSIAALRDSTMRRSIERPVLLAGMHHASAGREGSADDDATGAWKATLRALLHDVVDVFLDNTTYASDFAADAYKEMAQYLSAQANVGADMALLTIGWRQDVPL